MTLCGSSTRIKTTCKWTKCTDAGKQPLAFASPFLFLSYFLKIVLLELHFAGMKGLFGDNKMGEGFRGFGRRELVGINVKQGDFPALLMAP